MQIFHIMRPMQQGQPSRTAQEVAVYRAAHQILDRPRVFDDPLATRIIGKSAEQKLLANPQLFAANAPIRAFLAARSRYAEDQLARAVKSGVRQCVILGAGLDTFGYRNPHPTVRVFEVDHPPTQAWKRERLSEGAIAIPPNVTFVPVEFGRQTLVDGLKQSGFDAGQPAFFAMLGVVIFLPEATTMGILRFVASLPKGSGIVFDYGILESSLNPTQRAIREAAARQSAAMGEPFVTFFDPSRLAEDGRRMGFTDVDDLGYEQANAKYFGKRTDGLRVGSSGRRVAGLFTACNPILDQL